MNQKNKIQSGSQQITKTNYVSKLPPIQKNIYDRKRAGKPFFLKVSIKKPSPRTIGCFKIDVTWTLYKAINKLCL